MLHPDAPGRRGNFYLATTGPHPHLYQIMAVSTSADLPMMRVSFRYDGEDRYDARLAAMAAARERAKERAQIARQQQQRPPPTPLQAMDAACAANHDVYQRDRGEFSPSRVCHTDRETYIELPRSPTMRPDIPVLMELTREGDGIAPSHYDTDRDPQGLFVGIYHVTDVANYVLIEGKTRVRIIRAVSETAAK
jgi:type IV secretory pathway VirB9-like protein